MTFFETIRGTEVEIHAEEWDGDDSVGIPYGPEVVYATKLDDGSEFPLTDDELEAMTLVACLIEHEGHDDRLDLIGR